MTLALLLLLCVPPSAEEVLADRVSVIEINHVQCLWTGKETLVQVIYWRWWTDDQHHVAEWRTLSSQPHARFVRDGRQWVEVRPEGRFRREIRADSLRETWTVYDPEVVDRDSLPTPSRLPLRAVPAGR